ncbi:MAG TPA: aminopeptidase P family protein [Acidimicrobiia bacterium]|nr:aminopeptidase P family protein [Acidimicrobiia bacterium]
MNHAARLDALREQLEAPLLVSRAPNLRYLTGFTGSNGFLLVRPNGKAVFVTDGRYGELAEALVADLNDADLVVYTSGMWDVFRGLVEGLASVTLEADGVTWAFARDFASETAIEVVAGGGAVEGLRRNKDDAEIIALRAAAAAGDAAFSELGGLAGRTVTEKELGWKLIDVMRSHGGDAADWEPIVAAGPGASVPHYRAGGKPVGSGLLLLDYGCVVDGYHSDMSRTVWLEGTPDEQMSRVYRAVLESQEAGLAAVAPGVPCGDVDEAVREVLRGYGYEKQFLHSTGHGVGLEIHEPPWVRRGNDDPLAVGDVVTVEPGVYLPGIGGVRIEDMVLVTESGGAVLTGSHKEFGGAE